MNWQRAGELIGALHAGVRLRPTCASDLDLVLRLERDPANSPFVGQWSRQQHAAVIEAHERGAGREHWTIETSDGSPDGYLIAFDLSHEGRGMHIKRIVVDVKSRGTGREAVSLLCRHAFEDLAASFVWLDVLAGNLRAQRAYRAAGFEPFTTLSAEERPAWSAAVGGFCANDVTMFRRSGGAVASPSSPEC